MSKILVILGGPTAVGKTDLSIELAKEFKSEIISADARQFYKELNIGVAKPSHIQLKKIKHHFISHISIKTNYSVGQYEQDGLELLKKLFKKNDILFLCGGSGLYIDAICEGLNSFPKIDIATKEKINSELNEEGLDFLIKELKKNDLETYKKIDKKNPRRVMRAIEVYRSSGKPYSSYLKKEKAQRNFKTLFIGLKKNRKDLYIRINLRVEEMIKNGLIEEAKKLYKYKNYQALQTIGYQEVFKYLEDVISKKELVEEIQKNTRRYAKRQINWFSKEKYIPFEINKKNEIISLIQSIS